MCTFILAWQVFDGEPVVVAANRDEADGRPSHTPTVIEDDPCVVAPLDDRAGGTWIGYNEHGVVVSVTNRWTDADLTGDRSRGLLVRDALGCETAGDAVALVEESIAEEEYAGFNLVAIDAIEATLLEWDGTLTETAFDPGVHVVVNVGADRRFDLPEFRDLDTERSRVRRSAARRQADSARRALDDLAVGPGEDVATWLTRAKRVLADHDYGFCVHGDGYGTRSSSIIRLPEDGTPSYEFADGYPCEEAVSYEQVPDPVTES
jgi:uncharacterized protein with NRDE domain